MGLFFNDIVINIGSGNDSSSRVRTTGLAIAGGDGKNPALHAENLYADQRGYDNFTDFANDKVNPEDLRRYQEAFLSGVKKMGISKYIYLDHKHKKKYSGIYIASYKEDKNNTVMNDISSLMNNILNEPEPENRGDTNKKFYKIRIPKSKYNFVMFREEVVGGKQIYVIALVPKDF